MRVSVVLPVLNEENFVRIALDSLNDQTLPHELIVVDNGSSDRTVEIARLYTPLVFEAPRGKLNAKQLGVYEASGDVIISTDADVYYPPDFLEKITRHFNDSNVVIASGVIHHESPHIPKFNLGDSIRLAIGTLFFKYMPAPVTAYRRDAFLAAGGYNLSVNQFDFVSMVWEEEIGVNHRVMTFGRVVYDPLAEAYHYDRRGACSQCPNAGQEVCVYCREIAQRERF